MRVLVTVAAIAYATIHAAASEPSCSNVGTWTAFSQCQTCPVGGYQHPSGSRAARKRDAVAREASTKPAKIDISSRIVGGTQVPSSESTDYPFLCAFLEFGCGCTVIGKRWILTAAHCVRNNENYDIGIGRYDIGTVGSIGGNGGDQGINVRTVATYRHPKYNGNSLENDLALLKTASDIPVEHRIPALVNGVPGSIARQVGTELRVLGWGSTSSGGRVVDVLRYVDIPLLDDETCRSKYSYGSEFLSDEMLCLGRKEGGVDACQGDSGGPVVYVNPELGPRDFGKYELVGLTSWGYGCAEPEYPGVYTDLSGESNGQSYLEWIAAVTGGDFASACPSSGGYSVRTREVLQTGVSSLEQLCYCTGAGDEAGCPSRAEMQSCTTGGSVTTTLALLGCTAEQAAYDTCVSTAEAEWVALYEQCMSNAKRNKKVRRCERKYAGGNTSSQKARRFVKRKCKQELKSLERCERSSG